MNISLTETANALLTARGLVLTAHVNPDGDAVGSSLGLMHVLRGMGKEVQVFIDDDIPAIFSVLPGYEVIEKPEKEKREGKIKADALVVLDTAPDRIGAVADIVDAPVINIDHHMTNKGEAERSYVDADRAATAEIVYELVKTMGEKPGREAAMCLYTGMATDTGFFRYANTTPFTMRAAAELLECGVEPNVISEAVEQKTYEVVKGMAEAMQTIERFANGRAAGLFLDQSLTARIANTEGFIDMVRVIEGIDVAVLLKCKEEKLCRVSMRSKGMDVASIAAGFGGGGHVRAAGCTLEMTFDEAKKAIMGAISEAVGTGR